MPLKTTTAPLDLLTLQEWRDQFAAWVGVSYSNLDSTAQTELNRIVNEAHEKISARAAHYPWGQGEQTSQAVAAGTDTTYAMPAEFRHVIDIMETGTNATWRGRVTILDKSDFYQNRGTGDDHTWVTRTIPVWFFDGMTNAEPPVQQWRRLGVDNTAAEIHVLYRPYFSLLTTSGDTSYTQLPAAEVAAIREECRYKWALFTKDYEVAAIHRQARDEEIATLEINDREVSEDPLHLGVDAAFLRQLGD